MPLDRTLAVCAAATHVQVVRLKQCSSCAREIPDSATVCDACRQWASGVATLPSLDASPDYAAVPPSPAGTASPAPAARGKNRQLLFLVLVLVGGGIITLGLLSARGTSSSEVTSARPAAGAARPAAPTRAPRTFTQKWSTETSAYWVANRRKSAAFELPAENTVSIWMRSVRPSLVVRCMSQRTEVFVVTESAMKIEPQTEDHTVTFGFDDEANGSERWPDSAEHDALFAPDGAAFAQRLMRAQVLRFGYTPHNASSVMAEFNVAGLGPLIEPHAKECGWKK